MRKHIYGTTSIEQDESFVGESIERMIERQVAGKEPIKAISPMIYTKKSEGVRPETDIRTDRWDIALTAMDRITASNQAKSVEAWKAAEESGEKGFTDVTDENGRIL